MSSEVRQRKTLVGIVVSDKSDKTVVVRVERTVKHKVYKKYIRRHKKYHAHDERNECGVGDVVQIIENSPISKMKRWRVLKTIRKAA